MKKGKIKKEKDQISILLVPHSSNKVKVMRFSAFYSKLSLILTSFIIMLVCIGLFITYIVYENRALKSKVSALSAQNTEKTGLILEKSKEIDQLKDKEKGLSSKIEDYMTKYKEITDKYISNRSNNLTTNRSGDRDDRSFMNDLYSLKTILDDLNSTYNTGSKDLTDLSETESKLEKYAESIPTLWPTSGRISSNFGGRADPFWFRKRQHEGIDIAAPYGQDIKAAASGEVIFSGWYSGYGYAVIINHGHGLVSIYGHASKLIAKKGQSVTKGHLIAKVGSSGRSTGPHLHFEVRLNDDPVDPLKYLDDK